MGLDGVELILAIEDEFGVDIRDTDASTMYTVGDVFDYLKQHLNIIRASTCSSQKCFHRLRQAIVENYKIQRGSIRLESKLSDFLPKKDIREGWPYLQFYTYLKIPPDCNLQIFSRRFSETATIREVVEAVLSINSEILMPDVDSEEALWTRLVKVICQQLNVPPAAVRKDARFAQDLGVD